MGPPGYNPGDVIHLELTIESTSASNKQSETRLPSDGVPPGSRVEVDYGGQKFSGTVIALPSEDEEGKGRWTVQCDADTKGVFTYAETVTRLSHSPSEGGPVIEDTPTPSPEVVSDVLDCGQQQTGLSFMPSMSHMDCVQQQP